jgi:16S rRNA (adenine1518-N6/adenine1519-N6)-dimethyltransferase
MMRKKKDHYFMVDNQVLEKIVDYAQLTKDDTVLEIGAGSGNLTVELAEKAKKVIAIEKDEEFCEMLRDRVEDFDNVEVIEGDALKVDFPAFDKCVSNLPYGISKKITVKLLLNGFREAVLVYQREFARKLNTKPGDDDYRFISSLVQSTCEIELLDNINPNAFQPMPNVWSTIVKLKLKEKPSQEYVDFLRDLFNHKRKKLNNILKGKELPPEYADETPLNLTPAQLSDLYTRTF